MKKKKVVIAAGGTGGHLFPAQALASELEKERYPFLFAGAGLSNNRYFDRMRFPFREVLSLSPFLGKKALLKAPWILSKGVFQSMRLLAKEEVGLVVGFGSFHSFPLLLAARLKRIPLILFEPNAVPGKVNRLFSKGARLTAVLFDEVDAVLHGKIAKVAPLVRPFEEVSREKALGYFSLDTSRSTLLVFGGSQGAKSINALLKASVASLALWRDRWQIIHFSGSESEEMEVLYQKNGIRACVKPFETKMECAWSAADLLISRSGASTISEQLCFSTPALFIPYPYATDNHQMHNARSIEKKGGAIVLPDCTADARSLMHHLEPLLELETLRLKSMQNALKAVKENQNQQHLSQIILTHLIS